MEQKNTGYKRQCDEGYLAKPSGPANAQDSMCYRGSNAPGTEATPSMFPSLSDNSFL